jgi:hypothetical protein
VGSRLQPSHRAGFRASGAKVNPSAGRSRGLPQSAASLANFVFKTEFSHRRRINTLVRRSGETLR